MNENAFNLKMLNTNFDSPHGLMNIQNISTAYDMCKLLTKCMSLPLFRKIVNAKILSCGCQQNLLKATELLNASSFNNETPVTEQWFEDVDNDESDIVSVKETN